MTSDMPAALAPFPWLLIVIVLGLIPLAILLFRFRAPLATLWRTHQEAREAEGERRQAESAAAKPDRERLLGMLDLDALEVSDIMIHRTTMRGLDAGDPPEAIVKAVLESPYTRMPLWAGSVDNIIVIVHVFMAVLFVGWISFFTLALLRFRKGMASGVVETRLTVINMIGQLDELTAQPIERSPFYSPVLDFPDGVPEARRGGLRAAYATAIRETIYPAYRRLRAFLADEYLPAARAQVGISAMKGGPGLYRRLIERETTLPLDPEDVHTLGLSEVARIQREMDGVRRAMDFKGSLAAFFEHIRTDPQFHPRTAQELADGFAAIGKRVDAQVPRFFLTVPKTLLVIQPYPAYRAKYEAGASYNQGAPDGSRPGIFYFNTYDLPSRFLTGMATLYLHEGIPGHHFQISLAQEDVRLPAFQRFDGNNAFVEGWALYAETLGYPMGLYDDPAQRWGTLDDEMLRAMRLVVDTGLHAKGWSREQAIDYMLANSGMGRTDATAEVERYIAIPGQALSYKIGALTIQRLRTRAETALGVKFDIRLFHEQVLGSGAIPLPVLEAKIDAWIAAQK